LGLAGRSRDGILGGRGGRGLKGRAAGCRSVTIPVTGGSVRRRCAHSPSIRKTVQPRHLCSSWRKTTTSLRIALEYARKNSRNQKRILPTVSRSRVPDRGSCRSRASGAIAQQKPRQLGDVGGDPAARLVLSRRLLTARSSDPASEIETVKNCRPLYSPHRGDAGLRRRMRRCAICPTMSGMIERQSCARSPRECPTSTPSAPCLDWLKTTTNSATVRPSGREAAEPGYRRLFES
jgi:hypothetical protein